MKEFSVLIFPKVFLPAFLITHCNLCFQVRGLQWITLIIIVNKVTIHVLCVLLGIFGFLFLCNLNGKCVPFYRLSHLSKVAKICQINFKNS